MNQHNRLIGFLPVIGWLREYSKPWLHVDILAGLTAAAVVIPKAMAYATIAGLPVQVGLYTAFVPMLVYAVLGTSRPLSFSTTTTIAILAAAELGRVAPDGNLAALLGAGATLAILVGILLFTASVLRLGFVANLISEPVLTGFKAGIALVIVLDQLPKLLGVHIDKTGFLRDVLAIIQHLPQTSLLTLLLAVSLLLLIFLLQRFAPRLSAPLIAVGVAIAASAFFGLADRGVATVGEIPRGLPSIVLPQWDLIAAMWPAAAGIALMSFTETIAAARAFRESNEPHLVPNQELFASGVACVAGGLFGAMPAGGGTTQTAVNRRAGARTQLAELVTAAASAATLLLLAPLIAFMPQAALAAVVIAYSVELIKLAEFRAILRVRRVEFYWAVVAFAGVMFLGTLEGILVAVLVSLVSLAHQVYNPPVYQLARKPGTHMFRAVSEQNPDDESLPGLLLLKTEGRMFFANAERVGELMWPLIEAAQPKVLVLDCSAIFDIEYTALKMLVEGENKLQQRGISLWLAGLNPKVLDVVRRSPLAQVPLLHNVEAAVERYEAQEKP